MFDALGFLTDKFKDANGLVAFLHAYGAEAPPVGTVVKWFQRSSIPSDWLPVLLAYVEIDEGKPISVIDYITKR